MQSVTETRRNANRAKHHAAHVGYNYAYAMKRIIAIAEQQGDIKIYTKEEIAEYQLNLFKR